MTYILNGRGVDLGLDNVRNKEAKLTYLTFVWDNSLVRLWILL